MSKHPAGSCHPHRAGAGGGLGVCRPHHSRASQQILYTTARPSGSTSDMLSCMVKCCHVNSMQRHRGTRCRRAACWLGACRRHPCVLTARPHRPPTKTHLTMMVEQQAWLKQRPSRKTQTHKRRKGHMWLHQGARGLCVPRVMSCDVTSCHVISCHVILRAHNRGMRLKDWTDGARPAALEGAMRGHALHVSTAGALQTTLTASWP